MSPTWTLRRRDAGNRHGERVADPDGDFCHPANPSPVGSRVTDAERGPEANGSWAGYGLLPGEAQSLACDRPLTS